MKYLVTILMLSASLEIYAQAWQEDATTVFDDKETIGNRDAANRRMWMNGGWEDYIMNNKNKYKNSQLGKSVEKHVENASKIGGITVDQGDGTATTQSRKGSSRDVTKTNKKGASPAEVNARINDQRRQQQADWEEQKELERIEQAKRENKEYNNQMRMNAKQYGKLHNEVDNNAVNVSGLINKNLTGYNVESSHTRSDKPVVSQKQKPKLSDFVNNPQIIVESVIGLE